MLAVIGGARLATMLLQVAPNGPDDVNQDQGTQIALEAIKRHGGGTAGVLAMLVPFAFFTAVVLIFWLILRQKQARLKAQNELNKQLLDKFSSGREFGEFLASKEGQQFLAGLRSQGGSQRDRILRSVRVGIVFVMFGLGMIGLAIERSQRGAGVPGVVFLAIGIGLLLSAVVSNRISRRWEEDEKSQGAGPLAA